MAGDSHLCSGVAIVFGESGLKIWWKCDVVLYVMAYVVAYGVMLYCGGLWWLRYSDHHSCRGIIIHVESLLWLVTVICVVWWLTVACVKGWWVGTVVRVVGLWRDCCLSIGVVTIQVVGVVTIQVASGWVSDHSSGDRSNGCIVVQVLGWWVGWLQGDSELCGDCSGMVSGVVSGDSWSSIVVTVPVVAVQMARCRGVVMAGNCFLWSGWGRWLWPFNWGDDGDYSNGSFFFIIKLATGI